MWPAVMCADPGPVGRAGWATWQFQSVGRVAPLAHGPLSVSGAGEKRLGDAEVRAVCLPRESHAQWLRCGSRVCAEGWCTHGGPRWPLGACGLQMLLGLPEVQPRS